MKKICLISRVRGSLIAAGVAALVVANVRAEYTNVVLSDHPLAYYALNPGADPSGVSPDLSGNGNDGSSYNIVPVLGPSAYITNAAAFDGASTAVVLSSGEDLMNFTGPITIEAWAQPAATDLFGDIFAKGYDGADNYDEITLRVNGQDGGNYYGSSGSVGVTGGSETTTWNYLVLSSDGTNCSLYVNATLVAQASDTKGSITFPDYWCIGTGSADGASRFFTGNISQAALYHYGLTAAQVQKHFYAGEYGVTNIATAAPIITTQPTDQSAYAGDTVTFNVGVLSAAPTTNQWYKGANPIPGQTNASLTLRNVQAGDAVTYSVLVGGANGTTNSAAVTLTLLTPGPSLVWSSSGNDGNWDTANEANWTNEVTGQQSVFNTADAVLFNDAPGAPTSVTINGSVAPSILTVNSANNNYTLGGSGQIIGAGSLIKEGPSALTVSASGNFTGPVTIAGGTLLTGSPALTSAASITITNDGTLDFDGTAMQGNKLVTVSGAGFGGEGAIYNSGGAQYDQVLNITLAGDVTLGGSSRWDLGDGSKVAGAHSVTIKAPGGYGEWDTVSIGNEVENFEVASGAWGIKGLGADFGDPTGTITIDSGAEADVWNSSYGANSGYNKNVHVLNGANFKILNNVSNSYYNFNLTFEDSSVFTCVYGSGTTPMNGTLTLNGIVHFVFGDSALVFSNLISGPGGFVWDAYNHPLTFTAANTYSGPTVIGGGLTLALSGNGSINQSSLIFFGGGTPANISLDVTGRADQTLTLGNGQTLGGIGTIEGSLNVSPGTTLAPGGTNVILGMTEGSSATGEIIASGAITLNGTTDIKLDNSGTNDEVLAGAGISYGGTLDLINISGTALAAGNSFQIFSAGNSGAFASITPATPGPGLVWDTSQLSAGIIAVVTGSTPEQPKISSVTISGGKLIVSGINGSDNGNYVILTSTNIAAPLHTWTPIATNSFDGSGDFTATNAINPSTMQQFFTLKLQ